MSFLGFGKKKKVPSELPDLISDEIERESASELNNFLGKEEGEKVESKEIKDSNSQNTNNRIPELSSNQTFNARDSHSINNSGGTFKTKEAIRSEKNVLSRLVKSVEETPDREEVISHIIDKSFFSDVQKNISNEIDDLESLEKWYDTKFSSRDVLDDMKSYWKHQKKISVLESAGRSFKERISVKVSALQQLEKNWQMTYFDLIEKEEEIRDTEAELKEMLREFMNICKHKQERMNFVNGTQKNKNKKKKHNNNGGEKKGNKEKGSKK